MAIIIPDAQLDVALNDIKNNANILHLCSAQPANYAGIAAVSLGSVALTSSDFTVGDGDTSGRKITVAEKSVSITATDTVNHIVVADSTNSLIKGITTCPGASVTSGETKIVAAFDLWEIRDAA